MGRLARGNTCRLAELARRRETSFCAVRWRRIRRQTRYATQQLAEGTSRAELREVQPLSAPREAAVILRWWQWLSVAWKKMQRAQASNDRSKNSCLQRGRTPTPNSAACRYRWPNRSYREC